MSDWFGGREKRVLLSGVVILLLGLLIYEALYPDGQVARSIQVSGTGTVNAVPDLAYVTLGVQANGATPDGTVSTVTSRVAAVEKAVTAFGIPQGDLQTADYNLTPNYNYPNNGGVGVISGYQVTDAVTVKVKQLGDIGKIIAAAVAAGANQVQGVTFAVQDQSSYWQKAAGLAMDNARAKAKTIAAKAKARLGAILNVSEGQTGGVVPQHLGMMATQSANAPVINPGTSTVQVQVTVNYAY